MADEFISELHEILKERKSYIDAHKKLNSDLYKIEMDKLNELFLEFRNNGIYLLYEKFKKRARHVTSFGHTDLLISELYPTTNDPEFLMTLKLHLFIEEFFKEKGFKVRIITNYKVIDIKIYWS